MNSLTRISSRLSPPSPIIVSVTSVHHVTNGLLYASSISAGHRRRTCTSKTLLNIDLRSSLATTEAALVLLVMACFVPIKIFRSLLNRGPHNADNPFITGTCRQSVPGVRTGRDLPLVRNQENTTIIRPPVLRRAASTRLESVGDSRVARAGRPADPIVKEPRFAD